MGAVGHFGRESPNCYINNKGLVREMFSELLQKKERMETTKCQGLMGRHVIAVVAPPNKMYTLELWESMRVLDDDELSDVAEMLALGAWREVGRALQFEAPQLDTYENEVKGGTKKVANKMLYRWVQWRDQQATVGRLARVLFEEKAYSALDQLSP